MGHLQANPDARACLERWTTCRDEAAVARLLALHGDLVFSTALRILDGQRMLAEEVAQTVFAIMARKAATLRHHPSLAAWLHRAAVLEALHVRRRERTRLAHLAAFSREPVTGPSCPPPTAGPDVDLALERLAFSDRRLLSLRFYEQRSFPEMARHLGKSEAAIRKATSRALARLARVLGIEDRPAVANTLAAPLAVLAMPGSFRPWQTNDFTQALLAHARGLRPLRLFTHSLLMTTVGKSSTSIALIALLFLLGLGGSYSLGLAQARAKREILAAPGLASSAERIGPPKPAPIQTRLAGAAAATSPARIREILTVVAQEYETDIYGLAGARFTMNLPARVADFDHTCVPAALEMLPEFRDKPNQFESVAGFIFAAWAEHDLAAARAGLEDERLLRGDGKISGLAIRTVMEQWAVKEPVAALQWALGMVDSGRTAFDPVIGVGTRFFKHWAESDSQAALDELSRRAAAQPKLAADGVLWIMRDKDTQHVFLDRIGPVSTAAEREQALSLGRLSLQWLKPEHRSVVLDQLPLSPELREVLLKDL